MYEDGTLEGLCSPESLYLIQHEMSALITAIELEFVRLKYLSTSFMCEEHGASHSIKRNGRQEINVYFILLMNF